MQEDDPFRPLESDQSVAPEGPQFGASDDWLKPFDPSAESGAGEGEPVANSDPQPKMSAYVDSLGRVYPVDTYGNIIRKTCRPFGVATEQWKKGQPEAEERVRGSL